jgi:4-hydroxybutyryl-CoA dehydratase/vinylacetyl-CoA-Delta-isomerase
MFMSSSDYKESLRRYKPRVFVDGERIDSVADAPSLQPGINAMGVSYDFALRDELAPLMRAVQASSGKSVNRMLHIDASSGDLLNKLEAVRVLCQETGCAQALPRARCVQRARPGDRADRRDKGTAYRERFFRLPARRAGPRHQRRHRDDRREGRPQQASAPAGEPGQLRPHRRAHAAGHRHLGHQGDRDGGALRP